MTTNIKILTSPYSVLQVPNKCSHHNLHIECRHFYRYPLSRTAWVIIKLLWCKSIANTRSRNHTRLLFLLYGDYRQKSWQRSSGYVALPTWGIITWRMYWRLSPCQCLPQLDGDDWNSKIMVTDNCWRESLEQHSLWYLDPMLQKHALIHLHGSRVHWRVSQFCATSYSAVDSCNKSPMKSALIRPLQTFIFSQLRPPSTSWVVLYWFSSGRRYAEIINGFLWQLSQLDSILIGVTDPDK